MRGQLVTNYRRSFKEIIIGYLGLFASVSTLLCCALPALLVSLGLGAAMVSVTKTIPQILWIGENKISVFSFAFVMLVISSGLVYRNRNAPCPVDTKLREACISGRKYSKYVLILSWILLLIGFFFAYFAQYFV